MNQKNRTLDNGSLYYDYGFMKAAYGSFLEGLLVIYCNDLVADCAAERFNVSWERTSPMVMSVRDDNVRTVMSGESSFYFGRTAYGDLDAVKRVNFSEIRFAMQNEGVFDRVKAASLRPDNRLLVIAIQRGSFTTARIIIHAVEALKR